MEFKQRIKQLRLSRGLSQKKLAEATELTETAVQRYEYGARKPAYDVLLALAEYFDVSIDYLVGRTDNPAVNR